VQCGFINEGTEGELRSIGWLLDEQTSVRREMRLQVVSSNNCFSFFGGGGDLQLCMSFVY